MKYLILPSAIAALLIPSILTAGEFVNLLDGNDLSAWSTKGNWTVKKHGILDITPRPGETGWKRFDAYLWSKKKYGDFVLELEYKHPEGGNSGVFVRVRDPQEPVTTGIEAQILDSYGKPEPLTHHDLGGIIKTVGPSKNMAKPAGEWNQMTVTCRGSNLKVKLNGERIVDIDLNEHEIKDRPPRGYIGLQDHGLSLQFRNIRIKEL